MTYKRGIVDEQLKLQAAGTLTATGNGTAVDLGSGYAPAGGKPVQAAVDVTAVTTSGDQTYKFKLQDSPDDSTYTDRTPDTAVTAVGTTVLQGAIHNRYTRLVRTFGGTASASITIGAVYLDVLLPK